MATTATLTPVSSTGTSSSTTDNNSKINRKSSLTFDDLTSTNSTYRIPKRTNSTEMNESSTTKTLGRQSSDESNSQQAKRKFSLSQYKEHKRLKSNEIQQPSLEDTDMRINQNRPNSNVQSSPSTYIDDESAISNNDLQSVVSPKSEEISKDPVMKSNLSEPGVKKVNKKKVIWADEKHQALVQALFFEVDDSELSDMHIFARQCAANISIAQLEKVMERDLRKKRGIQDNNFNDNDDKQHSTPLARLIKIILPDTIQIPQIVSQERFIQEEREKTVLQALFIRSFLPDSPGEPDGEPIGNNTNNTEPKIIPLEDDSSATISNKISSATNNNSLPLGSISNPTSNSTTTPTATPSLSTFSFANISPEVAQILAQAKGNASTAQATTVPNTMTTTTATPSIAITNLVATPNLTAPPNLLSALLNPTTRANNNETPTIPPPPPNPLANLLPNLPLAFNLPPPPPPTFPLSLIANALSLGIPPPLPPTAANPSLFQPNPATFTAPPTLPNLSNPLGNNSGPSPQSSSTTVPTGNNSKPPSVRFVSAMGQQTRPNLSNNDHSMSSPRENSRDHHFRRGPPHHNRRDYYHNRNNNNNNNNNHNHNNNNNNNNNNNRNIFS